MNVDKQKRIAKMWLTYDEEGNVIYPEDIDLEKPAIAISGGGTRSFAAAIGYYRSLLKHDYLKNLSYCSSVSGGSWFNGIFSYSNINEEDLLGKSVKHINMRNLCIENFEEDSKFMGKCAVQSPVVDLYMESNKRGIIAREKWEYVIAQIFCRDYDLEFKLPVASKEEKKINEKVNHLECALPRHSFPIMLACVMGDEIEKLHPFPLEFTPLYTGCSIKNPFYGGILISNSGYGCDYTKISNKLKEVIVPYEETPFISFGMAASSAAYVSEVLKIRNTMLGEFLYQTTIKTRLFGPNSSQNHRLNVCDGGIYDNSGIIPLLSRGAKKILCFSNGSKVTRDLCGISLAHLFSVEDDIGCRDCHLREEFGVFFHEDWRSIKHELRAKAKSQDIVYFRRKLNVLNNRRVGVKGGYEVDLLFICLSEWKEFMDKIPKEVKDHPSFCNFPNYELLFENEGKVMELQTCQVNLLATFTEKVLDRVIELESDFFIDF